MPLDANKAFQSRQSPNSGTALDARVSSRIFYQPAGLWQIFFPKPTLEIIFPTIGTPQCRWLHRHATKCTDHEDAILSKPRQVRTGKPPPVADQRDTVPLRSKGRPPGRPQTFGPAEAGPSDGSCEPARSPSKGLPQQFFQGRLSKAASHAAWPQPVTPSQTGPSLRHLPNHLDAILHDRTFF